MPITVEVPGHGNVDFPDGMSDDQIAAAIKAQSPVSGGFMSDVGHGMVDQGGSILKGFKDIGGAVKDVATNAIERPSQTVMPMLKGFKQGAAEGVKQFASDPLAAQENFTGIHASGDEPIGTKVGRTITNLGAMAVPFAGRGILGAVGRGSEGGILRGAEALADASDRVKAGRGVSAPEAAARTPYGHGEASRTPFQPDLEMSPSEAVGSERPSVPAGPVEVKVATPGEAPGRPSTTTQPATVDDAALKEATYQGELSHVANEIDASLKKHGLSFDGYDPDDDWEDPNFQGHDDNNLPPQDSFILPPSSNDIFRRMADQFVEENHKKIGKPGDVPDNPVAQDLEQWRSFVDERPSIDPANIGTTKFYRGGKDTNGTVPGGTYWTPNKDFAEEYANRSNGLVHELHPDELSRVNNPIVIDFDKDGSDVVQAARKELGLKGGGEDVNLDVEEALPAFAKRGHDAVIIKGMPAADDMSGDELVLLKHGPTLDDRRSMVGAEEAARDPEFRAYAKDVGLPGTADDVRNLTGTRSHQPHKKLLADLDNEFIRHIMDEKGSIQFGPESWGKKLSKVMGADPAYSGDVKSMIESDNIRTGKGDSNPESTVRKLLADKLSKLQTDETGSFSPKDLIGALNQVRMMSYLSGLALPKSILGNISAIKDAAIERGSIAPVKEALRLPAVGRSVKSAWNTGVNPGGFGIGKANIPGRVMGAFDQATIDTLKRAGLTEEEANRLQLTAPDPLGQGNLGKSMEEAIGKGLYPFQRIPFNQLAEGIKVKGGSTGSNFYDPNSRGGSIRRAGLTAATAGAGYELGQHTKDPRILGLAAALSGVRGVPMLIGAGFGGAGRDAVAGLSPLPEWSIPSSPKDLLRLTGLEPAAIKAYGLNSGGRSTPRSGSRTPRKGR